MLKLLKVALCSALFVVGSNASDFLAKATNGITSDNDFGVKKLNDSEMNNIKGGYLISANILKERGFAIAIAVPDDDFELGAYRDKNTQKLLYLYPDATSGICDPGVTQCYANKDTFTHSERSVNRLLQYTQALGPYTLVEGYLLAYMVNRKVGTTDRGTKFTYFTHETAAYNLGQGTIHPITSSFNLNNPIIKELKELTQKSFEQGLGGLQP